MARLNFHQLQDAADLIIKGTEIALKEMESK